MSIFGALQAGVSGLGAEGEALGVVGDNVANTNTVGFKQSRAVFEDVLGGAVGNTRVGGGVHMARTQQIFAQGALLNTGEPTDLALSGDGFFVVHGTLDGVTKDYYSRDGQTNIRADGTLVNSNGMALQGFGANADGTFGGTIGNIQLPTAALPPKPTSAVKVTANLDAAAAVPTAPWNPQSPGSTSNFSTSMKVYDSLGKAHAVDVYFVKTAPGAWEYHALTDGGGVQGGTVGQPTEIQSGTLSFDPSGGLSTNSVVNGGSVSFADAATGQPLTFDFGTPQSAGGTGLSGLTQFGSPSTVSSQSQDGYTSGDLSGVKIDGDGTVRGVYSNGEAIAVGKLAVAKFRSNDGLGRAGHNLWSATADSGQAAVGGAGSSGRAGIVSGALEQSNVDIATQFVGLIAHQRAFQANSKTITTADQMLQELVNIKQ